MHKTTTSKMKNRRRAAVRRIASYGIIAALIGYANVTLVRTQLPVQTYRLQGDMSSEDASFAEDPFDSSSFEMLPEFSDFSFSEMFSEFPDSSGAWEEVSSSADDYSMESSSDGYTATEESSFEMISSLEEASSSADATDSSSCASGTCGACPDVCNADCADFDGVACGCVMDT